MLKTEQSKAKLKKGEKERRMSQWRYDNPKMIISIVLFFSI